MMHNIFKVCMNTGNPFRSSDLGVMSPARFLCAMPVEQNNVDVALFPFVS